jgi:hypothetical protein
MAKEKNLTAVTSVAAADFARVVTSAGASVKATFANIAKYIIETYNGSTVAGSAQSVKSALDSLNSNLTGVTSNSRHDVNSYCDMFIKPSNTSGYPNTTLELRPQKNGTNNILQIYVNGIDYGYITFDVSRNVGVIDS